MTTPLSRCLRGSCLFVQVLGDLLLPPIGLIPWFSKTEGNTYATLLHHPFLFKGKPTHAQEVTRRISGTVAGEICAKSKSRFDLPSTSHFWRRCRGDLRTSQDIPSTHHKLLSLTLHYLPFSSRFSLPHFTFAFSSPSSRMYLCLCFHVPSICLHLCMLKIY